MCLIFNLLRGWNPNVFIPGARSYNEMKGAAAWWAILPKYTYLANPKLQNVQYYLVNGPALQALTVPADLRNADAFLYHSKGAPKAKHLPLHLK